MTVCIISEVDDLHAICVEHALERKGQPALCWHWSDFPTMTRLDARLDGGGGMTLSGVPGLEDVSTLWIHRGLEAAPGANLHPADVPFVAAEANALLSGIVAELSRTVFCVNPPAAVRRNRAKLSQLRLAASLGWTIPETLISNDPAAIRAFYREQGGAVVVKHAHQMYWASAADGRVRHSYTSRVTERQLENDRQLAACPSIFQSEVAKAFELRVIFMGGTVFAARIDSQRERPTVDWRQAFLGFPPCAPFELPPCELERVRAFISASGLVHGSIDLIVDPDGRYVFLEVNESGQFLWLEQMLPEYPLLDSFAEFLASGDPEFTYRPGAHVVRYRDVADTITAATLSARSQGHRGRVERARLLE
jgi:glutathione synthase/RimK-type ligase-like ATP-grasp enzyme